MVNRRCDTTGGCSNQDRGKVMTSSLGSEWSAAPAAWCLLRHCQVFCWSHSRGVFCCPLPPPPPTSKWKKIYFYCCLLAALSSEAKLTKTSKRSFHSSQITNMRLISMADSLIKSTTAPDSCCPVFSTPKHNGWSDQVLKKSYCFLFPLPERDILTQRPKLKTQFGL